MMSAAAFNSAARSSGAVRLHAGNAAAAAAAADSTSSTVDSGASPTTCSVAGLTIAYVDMAGRLERVLVLTPMPEIPRIISVDDHVVEPPDLWTSRMTGKFK